MPDEVKLEPCPFCARDAEIEETGGSQSASFAMHYRVNCKVYAHANMAWTTDRNEAIAAWNTRPTAATGQDDVGWMIERADLEPSPHYFAWKYRPHTLGDRFPTKEAAEAHTNGDPNLRVCDHCMMQSNPIWTGQDDVVKELVEALKRIAESEDWNTVSRLRSIARLSLAKLAPRARTKHCPTCGGEFDEAEWNSASACPECETPKPALELP